MANSIGQAYVQILPTTKGFSSKLSSEIGGGISSVGESSGKGLGGKILKGVAAVGIGAAIGKGISASIQAGGDLEQSLGGVEAIFGKSADKVKQNASKAFETVGMSANDYMQNVTSFSASLLQGLNGDTETAAKYADMAMKDMGDNANRFGTDIQSIQNAYQGFAKGNFTMLDNLKLGYGGTKEEMLRLLHDTGVVDKSINNLDNVSFDQMIEGIHKAQEGLSVTGTTANEASSTIQGSMASMKASVQDLLGNLAIGADITPQIKNLLNTAQSFLINNLLPMLSNVVLGVANNAGQLATTLSSLVFAIGKEIIKLAPKLLQAGITLVVQLGKSLVTGLPKLIPMVTKVITQLALMLTKPKNLEMMITTAIELMVALSDGLVKAIPQITKVLPQIVTNIVTTLIKLAPKLHQASAEMIIKLAVGLTKSVGILLNSAGKIIKQLISKFANSDWAKAGKDTIQGIINGVTQKTDDLINSVKDIGKRAWKAFKEFFHIGSPSKLMTDTAKWIPIGAAIGVEKNAHYLTDAVDDMMSGSYALSSRGMSMDISARDNTSAYSYAGIYNAIKQGASEATPVIVLNDRVLSRELKGMGVSFA